MDMSKLDSLHMTKDISSQTQDHHIAMTTRTIGRTDGRTDNSDDALPSKESKRLAFKVACNMPHFESPPGTRSKIFRKNKAKIQLNENDAN